MAMFSHTFEIMMMLNAIWPAVCTFSCHPPLPLRIFHSAYSGCPKRKLKGGGGGGRWIGRGKGSWRRPNSQSTHISLCVCDLVVVNVARTRRIQHTTTFKRKKTQILMNRIVLWKIYYRHGSGFCACENKLWWARASLYSYTAHSTSGHTYSNGHRLTADSVWCKRNGVQTRTSARRSYRGDTRDINIPEIGRKVRPLHVNVSELFDISYGAALSMGPYSIESQWRQTSPSIYSSILPSFAMASWMHLR